ncbi:MAG: energy transducer TonB [Archangiaceae bacterium]|nr:energy transducer TonB [Archangiaceae bacterium]
MFDSVLQRDSLPKSKLGSGAAITVLVHAVLIAGALWLSAHPPEREEVVPEVKFFAAPPPPPPPPPPAGGSAPKVEKKEKRKPKATEIVQPKEIPQEKPKEAEAEQPQEAEEAVPGGVEGGVQGGVEGGQVGGVVGGTVGGVLGGTGTEVMAFGEGMTRPENIRSPPGFECPREAREAHIDGTMLASCTVTPDGYLKNCKIIKPLPFMEGVALDLLARWRVGPVFFQGSPVMVNYKIPIRMVCK